MSLKLMDHNSNLPAVIVLSGTYGSGRKRTQHVRNLLGPNAPVAGVQADLVKLMETWESPYGLEWALLRALAGPEAFLDLQLNGVRQTLHSGDELGDCGLI